MKIKSYLYSGVLYLICLLHLTFCTGCEEIFKPNNDSKQDKLFEYLLQGLVSLDGSFSVRINSYMSLGNGSGIMIPYATDVVWYNGSYYKAFWASFEADKGSFSLYKGRKSEGDIKIIAKEFHGEDEVTVSVTGTINISSIRMKIGKVPSSPSASSFAHYGFKGMVNENVEAKSVTCDGKSQLRFTFDEYAYDVTDIDVTFYDASDRKISDEKYSGSISSPKQVSYGSEQKWYVIYTAPEIYDPERNPAEIELELLMGSVGHEYSLVYTLSPSYYRCGVGLVHGLNSNAEDCFRGLASYLQSEEGYEDYLIQLIDYKRSNRSAFDYNEFLQPVVDKNLSEMYERLLDRGIVSSRYDLVGHSMGGILSRLYAQKTNPNAVRKIITLDTPHYGSELADILEPAIENLINSCEGTSLQFANLYFPISEISANILYNGLLTVFTCSAVRDLRPSSAAIQALNDETRLDIIGITGVHSICSVMEQNAESRGFLDDSWDGVHKSVERFSQNIQKGWNSLLTFFKGSIRKATSGPASWEILSQLYNEDTHDGIVSLTSQKGGLRDEFITIETSPYLGSFGWESKAHHCNTNKWDVTYHNIGQLLQADAKGCGKFCFGGYGLNQPKSASIKARATEEGFHPIENNGENSIQIVDVDNSDSDYLEFRLLIGDNIENVMIIANFEGDDDDYWFSAGAQAYRLFLDGKKGKMIICAVARTEDNGITATDCEVTINH